MAKLTAVTAINMMFIGSRNCFSATRSTDGGFSAMIWFGPNRDSRAEASAAVNPIDGSDPNPAATSAASRAYGGGAVGWALPAGQSDHCYSLADGPF